MFDPELVAFLESGCALIVGTVSAAGVPRVERAWGLEVIDAAVGRVRVLIGSDDDPVVDNLGATRRVAVTGADVLTLRSAQLKGRIVSIEPPSAADRARSDRYCDDFFEAVGLVDQVPRERLDRLVPVAVVACEVLVDDVFDQTPGPTAGSVLTQP